MVVGHTCLGIFSKSFRVVVGEYTGRTGPTFGVVFISALTELVSVFPEICVNPYCLVVNECSESLPPNAPSSGARSASARYPLPPRFTTVHLILQEDERLRQRRRPVSSPPGKLIHTHRNVAAKCLRAVPGRNSHHSHCSLVDPASSLILVSKIKSCMSQCKPH